MKTTRELETMVAELEAKRNEKRQEVKNISEEIRKIKRVLYQRYAYQPSENTGSAVYQLFGKHTKDLTKAERRKYDAIRQAKTREKKRNA